MNVLNAISSIIESSGMSKRAVSERLGKHPNYITSIQSQSAKKSGGVNSATLANLADVCGYALALVPKDAVGEGMLVIDPPEQKRAK